MPLLTPYARDSQSFYDWPSIITATALSSAAATTAIAYLALKALGSENPIDHFSYLADVAIYKALGFKQIQAETYLAHLSEHKLEMSAVWTVALIAGIGIGYLTYKASHIAIDSDKHVKGRRLLKKKEAIKDIKLTQDKSHKISGKGLKVHPYLTLSRAQEVQSFLFMASQGGGKTQVLWRLLTASINRGDKNIIYDLVKGDFTKSVGKSPNGLSPVLISPWDLRSLVWDIARDCKTLADAISFARGLIPMTSDPLWATAARSLLTAILVKLQQEKGTEWGWSELNYLAYLKLEDLKEIAAQYYPPALAAVEDAESKTSQSIYINMHTFLSVIYRLNLLWKDSTKKRFSFVDWINDDGSKLRNIIVQGNLEDEELSASYVRSITEILTNRIASLEFKESKTRRVWFWLDEVKQAGKIECLARLMEYGRSKGICCVLAIQDISQIRQLYPAQEDQKWLALCGMKFYGQIRGGDSQKFVTEQVGSRIVDRFNQSVNRSTSSEERSINSSYTRDAQASILHESELEELGLTDENGGGIKALVVGVGKNAYELQWSFYDTPDLRSSFVSSTEAVNQTMQAELVKDPAPIFSSAIPTLEAAVPSNERSDEVLVQEKEPFEIIEDVSMDDLAMFEKYEQRDHDAVNEVIKEAAAVGFDEVTDSNIGLAIEAVDMAGEVITSKEDENPEILRTQTQIQQQQRKRRYVSKKELLQR